MLDLESLYESEGNKNDIVLSLGEKLSISGKRAGTFNFLYGILCGDSNNGLLIEESLQILFEISEILILSENTQNMALEQNKKKYLIKKVENKYLDFNHAIIL